MNKKTKTIALIIITVLVWGYSALEWIDYMDASDEEYSTQVSQYIPQVAPLKLKPQQKSDLQLNYRDPFLNKKTKNKVTAQAPVFSSTNRQQTRTPSPIKPKETTVIKWPKIVYSGVINNQLGLLKIDDKDYLVKAGDVKNEVIINEIFSDKIIISFKAEQKEFEKES